VGRKAKQQLCKRETIISFNTTREKKQTTKRNKHEKKLLLLKKWGPSITLGPFIEQ